jgi:hypothetical protein
MQRSTTPRSSLWKVARSVFMYAAIAGVAIVYGESQRTTPFDPSGGVFWLAGESWWAPDQGYCPHCGVVLVPKVDSVGACRHCENCDVAYRHKTLPATLELQGKFRVGWHHSNHCLGCCLL